MKTHNNMPPEYLSDGASVVWNEVMKRTPQIELDDMDKDILAMYCDAVDKYKTLSKMILSGRVESMTDAGEMKALKGWARIIGSCADKLCLTPGSRKKKNKRQV